MDTALWSHAFAFVFVVVHAVDVDDALVARTLSPANGVAVLVLKGHLVLAVYALENAFLLYGSAGLQRHGRNIGLVLKVDVGGRIGEVPLFGHDVVLAFQAPALKLVFDRRTFAKLFELAVVVALLLGDAL